MLTLPRFYGLEKNRTPADREQFVRTITTAGYDPRGVGAVIELESARTWSPSVKGPAGTFSMPPGYPVGLLQFAPQTAQTLGTSTAALERMTFGEQLGYVVAYYGLFGGPSAFTRPGDYYLAGFGASPQTPNSKVLTTRGKPAYTSNALLDSNKDGELTAGELRGWIDRGIASAESRGVWTFDETPPAVPVYRVVSPAGVLLGTAQVSEVDAPGSTILTALYGAPSVVAYPDQNRALKYNDEITIPARKGLPYQAIVEPSTNAGAGGIVVGGLIAVSAIAIFASTLRVKPNRRKVSKS